MWQGEVHYKTGCPPPPRCLPARDLFKSPVLLMIPPSIDHSCPLLLCWLPSLTPIDLILTYLYSRQKWRCKILFKASTFIECDLLKSSFPEPYIWRFVYFPVPYISASSVPINSDVEKGGKVWVHILHMDPSLGCGKWCCGPFGCHQSGSGDVYSTPPPPDITTTCFN